MLGSLLLTRHLDLPGLLSASPFSGTKMLVVSLTFRSSAGPQTRSNFYAFLFRRLTLGSKGYSSGVQDNVKMKKKPSMHVFYGLQTKRSGYVHYQRIIYRWNNASLYFYIPFFWLSWINHPWFRSVYLKEFPRIPFLSYKPWSPTCHQCHSILPAPQLFCYWSIFVQGFLCHWNSPWPFQVVCLSGLALAPTSLLCQ